MKYILLIFLILIGHQHIYASEIDDIIDEIVPRTTLSSKELKLLKDELRIQSMIIEGVKQIQIDSGSFLVTDQTSSSLERIIKKATQARVNSFGSHFKDGLSNIARTTVRPLEFKQLFTRYMNNFNSVVKSRGVLMSSMTRRFGMQVGLFYLVMTQVDYTLPFILMASGNIKLGGLLLNLPISTTTTALFAGIKGATKNLLLMRKFGFRKSYESLINLSDIRKFFNQNLMQTKRMIDLSINKKRFVFSIEEKTMWKKILFSKGYESSITFENLSSFLEKESTLFESIKVFKESKDPEIVKTLKTLYVIEKSEDSTLIAKLVDKFGKNIKEIEGLYSSDIHRRWFTTVSSSQNFDQLLKSMKDIPSDIPPRVFDKVWRSYVIPTLSKNIQDYASWSNYKAFRALINNWDTMMRENLSTNSSYNLDKKFKVSFSEYIFKSFESVGACSHVFTNSFSF